MTDYAAYLGLELTEDQDMILDMVSQLADDLVAPAAESIDHQRALTDELRGALAESGLYGLRAPEAFGGVEMDATTELFAQAILGRASASVGLEVMTQSQMFIAPLAAFAAEADGVAAFAERVISGESRGAFAWQEESDSDRADLMFTRVEESGDRLVLNGKKLFVLGAEGAEKMIVVAAEGESLSTWLVDASTTGVEVTPGSQRLGMTAVSAANVSFNDVTLEASQRVGAAGAGAEVLEFVRQRVRLGLVALATGVIAAARDASARYATERRQFNKPISDFDAIREKLANMEASHAAAACLLAAGARRLDAGSDAGAFIDAARVSTSENAMIAADDAVQVYGGYGYSQEYPVERLYRDARFLAIAFGGNDRLRVDLAASLLPT